MNEKPHRNLKAWQSAMDVAVAIYKLTERFPAQELYGIISQLRRAAISVPSNIAEGAADRTKQQFINFLSNAIGSLNEMDTQLELAKRLRYLTDAAYNDIQQQLNTCTALTYGLKKSLRKRELSSTR